MVLKFFLQRREVGRDVREHAGDAAHFRSHAGGDDHGPSASVRRRGAAVDHVRPIAEGGIAGDRVDVLGHRHALAGECGLRHTQGRGLDDTGIGRCRIAFLDDEDVAGDHVRGRDGREHAIPNDMRMCRRHLLERSDSGLSALFLQVAHDSVQQYDGTDGNRFVGQGGVSFEQPEDGGNGRGDQQQDHQQVRELREELLPLGNRTFGGQPIRTPAFESRTRFDAGQAAGGIRRVRGNHLFDALLVLGGHGDLRYYTGPIEGEMRHREVHRSDRIGWLRAAVLGANDGIVSTASLVVGVAAAAATRHEILVAGVAGLVAGALSMAAGEYVSVSSQADTEQADLALERRELATQPKAEEDELTAIYVRRGLDHDLARTVARQLTANDALTAHARDELGLIEELAARPLQAALASAATFSVGAGLPVLTVLIAPAARLSLVVSIVSLLCLVALGAIAARAGGARAIVGATRVAFWGALAMAVTAGVGKLFGTTVG